MPEYINRSELAKGKYHPLPYTHITPPDVDVESYKRGWNDAIDAAIDAIPAADVVEVRHESWKDIGIMWIDKTNQPDGISTMFCPACERYATRIYYYGNPTDMMNFCPNCGAKMDGGQDDV